MSIFNPVSYNVGMEVFKRHEAKYLITREQKDNFLRELKDELTHSRYYKSTIENVYLDTENDTLITKSIDKPNFKEKVRVRSYGVPRDEDKVFFEIKTKQKTEGRKNGYKRRIELTLGEYKKWLSNEVGLTELKQTEDDKNSDKQVAKELEYLCRHLKLRPRIFIAYERESWEGMENTELRITFDENLRYRTEDLNLDGKKECTRYFGDDEKNIIMEIKAKHGLPLTIVKVMNRHKIYPQPFSKYGKIFEKIRKEENV